LNFISSDVCKSLEPLLLKEFEEFFTNKLDQIVCFIKNPLEWKPIENPAYLMKTGLCYLNNSDEQDNAKALSLFTRVYEMDPEFGEYALYSTIGTLKLFV
jgi:hypothetical protein